MSWLCFNGDEGILKIALLGSGGGSGCPPTESRAQFQHGKAVCSTSDSFEEVDPFEILIVKRWIFGRYVPVMESRGPQHKERSAIATTKEICFKASGDKTCPVAEVQKDFVVFAFGLHDAPIIG